MKTKRLLRRLQNRGQETLPLLGSILVNSKRARAGYVAFTVLLGLLYVLQMNVTATKGYDIRELEQQKTALQKQTRQLELEAMELQSVDRLMAQLPEFRLVEAKPDAFVSTAAATFAAR